MNNSSIVIIIYIMGLVFGALCLGIWDEETTLKSILGIVWTSLFLIALFYSDKKNLK